jgi:CDP-2,3-bis-(O-geranylgeranyl)-sn-glycerol synthase
MVDVVTEALAAVALATAQALYLFSPLLIAAGLAAIVMRRDGLSFLNRPIDGGARLRGKRWLGDGKTWRGVVLAVVGCCLGTAVQRAAASTLPDALQVVDYAAIDALGFGAALGLGAVLGELPNSFVKRRLGIPRGETAQGPLAVLFYVWDQVDTLLGAWPLASIWLEPRPLLVVMSMVLVLTVHPAVAWVGYHVGARSSAR